MRKIKSAILNGMKSFSFFYICRSLLYALHSPLPRGFMAYDEVCTVINVIPLLMVTLAGALFWRYDIAVASTYIFCVRNFPEILYIIPA